MLAERDRRQVRQEAAETYRVTSRQRSGGLEAGGRKVSGRKQERATSFRTAKQNVIQISHQRRCYSAAIPVTHINLHKCLFQKQPEAASNSPVPPAGDPDGLDDEDRHLEEEHKEEEEEAERAVSPKRQNKETVSK